MLITDLIRSTWCCLLSPKSWGVIFCLIIQVAHGQRVIDALSGDPLPSVTVTLASDRSQGSITDSLGRFVLDQPVGTEIELRYVGYSTLVIPYTGQDQLILLERQITHLDEIVISADESEAARIINLCVNHRAEHAPKMQPYYQCLMYNRFEVSLIPDSIVAQSKFIRMLERKISSNKLFFSESAIRYTFQSPDRLEAEVVANHIAGFKEAQFNFAPEQFVDMDINRDFLEILTRQYLLPVSKNSYKHYGLHLEDTKISNGDTTWHIVFWPEHAPYDLLRGHLVIHSDGYALQEYRLTNAQNDHQSFDIYHTFKRFNGRWFPEKMFTDVVLEDAGTGVVLQYSQRSYLDSVEFEPIKVSLKDANRMTYAESVTESPDKISAYRPDIFTKDDSLLLQEVESSMRSLNVEKKTNLIAHISFGRLVLGRVDLDITRLFTSNRSEGYRPGIGLRTNDFWHKRWGIEAYAGYGLKDHLWKYSGGGFLHFNEEESATLYARYEHETYAINTPIALSVGAGIVAGWYNDRLEDYSGWSVGLRGRLNNFDYDLSMTSAEYIPRYAYLMQLSDGLQLANFELAECNLSLRYVKTQRIPFYNYEIILEDYDNFSATLNLKGSNSGVLNSDLTYWGAELFIKQPLITRHLGRIDVALQTGVIKGDAPISRLHICNGTRRGHLSFRLPYSFNALTPYQFVADRYVNLFFDYRWRRLFASRYSAPYLHFIQQSGWGWLDHSERHLIWPVEDYRLGYHECGIELEYLLRYEVFNIFEIGLNASGWMIYGPYAVSDVADNLSFKIGLTMGF